jgi:hypothetical protein
MDSPMDKIHTDMDDRHPNRVCQSPVSTQLRGDHTDGLAAYEPLRDDDPIFLGQDSDRDSCAARLTIGDSSARCGRDRQGCS